jgi:uncharacterized membrane protein YfcA
MWTELLVLAVALAASALSFFSGFGLGTLLLPAFALAFPLDVAVAATAAVHLANNLWKAALVGRHADRGVVARFGLPAVAAAFAGAGLLLVLQGPALRVAVGVLITLFALFELVPALRGWTVPPRWLPAGGLLSGFFGGLSGHQGALRSAFLARALPDARSFVATGAVCAVLVDVSRTLVYGARYAQDASALDAAGWRLVAAAAALSLAGAIAGARLLPKATLEGVRLLVGVLLLVLGPAIALGLL